MKKVIRVAQAPAQHWVGDGFPVRSMFSYQEGAEAFSPFLLLDYAAPTNFSPNAPSAHRRGVGTHPHRGFETVTYMLEGAMMHRDHLGNQGHLRKGDVQWMTAAHGIIHSEMPEQENGLLHGFQLWLNLPAKEKMKPPHYRDIAAKGHPPYHIRKWRLHQTDCW